MKSAIGFLLALTLSLSLVACEGYEGFEGFTVSETADGYEVRPLQETPTAQPTPTPTPAPVAIASPTETPTPGITPDPTATPEPTEAPSGHLAGLTSAGEEHFYGPTPTPEKNLDLGLRPEPSPSGLKVIGPQACIDHTLAALDLLEAESGAHHDLVLTHVNRIFCDADMDSLGEFRPLYSNTILTNYRRGLNRQLPQYAATLAHESCHAEQVARGGIIGVLYGGMFPREMELECDHVTFDTLVALDYISESQRSTWIRNETCSRWGCPTPTPTATPDVVEAQNWVPMQEPTPTPPAESASKPPTNQDVPPHIFVGVVTVNGEPVQAGLPLYAEIDGEIKGKTTTKRGGEYALLVGVGNEWEITFRLVHTRFTATARWEKGGADMLDLALP